MAVRTTEEVVAAAIAEYDGDPAVVHRAIHGTDDPHVIAGQLEAYVEATLGVGVVGARFHAASVGSVTGVTLADGRDVVVKAYQDRWSQPFLAAVVEAQTVLHLVGIPCALPLAPPALLEGGLATIETWLPDPGPTAVFGPSERRASAEGLAALIAAAPELEGLRAHPMLEPSGGLYPTPHSPLFDFEATAVGAEWIDAYARAAAPLTTGGRPIVAHTDWSARNVRLSASGVEAVYDLDSLAWTTLPAALGGAAMSWRAVGEASDGPAPGMGEARSWLADFPETLTQEEERSFWAHTLFHLAYTARCEHAVDPGEERFTRSRPTLRSDGPALLAYLNRRQA
jgi:hypothetical protein